MDYGLGVEAALETLGVKLAGVVARVYSMSQKGKRYTVREDDGQYSCSCPDFKYRHAGKGTQCKHIKTRVAQVDAKKPVEPPASVA